MPGRGRGVGKKHPKGKLILFTDGVSIVAMMTFFPSNPYPVTLFVTKGEQRSKGVHLGELPVDCDCASQLLSGDTVVLKEVLS